MKRIILAALVGALVSGPAVAVDETGSYYRLGMGSEKCAKYLGAYGTSELKHTPDGQFSFNNRFGIWIGWIHGYATRVNMTTKGRANIYDMDSIGIAAWLASWCRDNPSKDLTEAMNAFTQSRLKQ